MALRDAVRRVPGDRYLGHRADGLRIARPGFRVRGKRNLMKLHSSFNFQPGIGVGADGFVATICKAEGRYVDIDDVGAAGGCRVIKYGAEGGMNDGGTEQIKDQNPERSSNRALRRSAQPGAPLVQVWRGFRQRRAGGSMYVYMGLYRVSNWRERTRTSGLRYFKVRLTRRACDNGNWKRYEVVSAEEDDAAAAGVAAAAAAP